MKWVGIAVAGAAAIGLAACQTAGPQVARADFQSYCAGCHGADGKGNGPAASGLDPKPADLTTISARNGGVFPLEAVMSQIDGYTRGPGAMPEFGAYLQEDRMVMVETEPGVMTPAPERLVLIAQYLETIQE